MNKDWSIRLIVGDGDVDNFNSFELVFNQGTNTKYKLTQGTGSISGQEPSIVTHASDDNAQVPARFIESNKLGRFEVAVLDDENTTPEWDTILNNIHTLNRIMSGASSTAARYGVSGTAEKVRLAILPDGATNTTYFEIQSGWSDVSSAYYKAESQQGSDSVAEIGAYFIPLNFTFKTGGEGDSFTLRNDLPSSPHFIEDSSSPADGLADGWVAIGPPTTTDLNTTHYLVGGQSQRFVTDAVTTHGIRSDSVTAIMGSNAVASVWVAWNSSANDVLSIKLQDGSNNDIDTAEIDPALPVGYDKKIVSSSGKIFFRVILSGTNSAAANFRLRVTRGAADATSISIYFVDAAYLQTGTLTAPDGWCSSSSLKNRYDPTSASAATQQQINYLDVWGIPGDLPAYVQTKINAIDITATGAMQAYVGKKETGLLDVTDQIYIKEGEDITTTARWTTVASASAHGGDYKRNANTGTTENAVLELSIPESVSMFFNTKRLFIRCKSNVTGCTIAIDIRGNTSQKTILSLPAKTITNSSDWYFLDMGLVNGQGLVSEDNFSTFDAEFYITTTAPSAANIDIDVCFFFPIDEFLIYKPLGDYDAMTAYLGGSQNIYNDNSDNVNRSVLGSLYKCLPNEESRYFYIITSKEGIHRLGDLIPEVELTVTPRTSHLLGTQ